jgi:hypothetical protein
MSDQRGFLSTGLGCRNVKDLRCASHERRRFLHEVDTERLLYCVPDEPENCTCRWEPEQNSASAPVAIQNSGDSASSAIVIEDSSEEDATMGIITQDDKSDSYRDGERPQKRRKAGMLCL